MDEVDRLERVVAALREQLAVGQPLEFVIHQRQDRIQVAAVPRSPDLGEHPRNITLGPHGAHSVRELETKPRNV
jgi:hypothetical protein